MDNFIYDFGNAVRKMVSSVNTDMAVAARKQNLKDAYQKLGRMYYRASQAGCLAAGEEFDAQVEKIESLLREINDLRCNENVASEEDFADRN